MKCNYACTENIFPEILKAFKKVLRQGFLGQPTNTPSLKHDRQKRVTYASVCAKTRASRVITRRDDVITPSDDVIAPCACVQVSQYTFAMCSYRERKADPTDIQQLDGFTVDYCEQSLIEGRQLTTATVFVLAPDRGGHTGTL